MLKRKYIIRVVFIITACLIIFLTIQVIFFNFAKINACFDDNCFVVEIADSNQTRAQGLMFRKNLPENEGMFFIFEKTGIYPFWMKNNLIPLDIIWLDQDKKIVYMTTAQPCENNFCLSITPTAKALYVLEINAGLTKKLGLNKGDKLFLKRKLPR